MKFSLLTLALITPLLSTPVPQDNLMGPRKPPVKVAVSSNPKPKPNPKPNTNSFSALNVPKSSNYPTKQSSKFSSIPKSNIVKSSKYPPQIPPVYSHQYPQSNVKISSKNPTKKAANFDSVPESNIVSPSIYPRIIPFYPHQFPQKYPAKQPISIKPINNKPSNTPNVVKSTKTTSQISQKNVKSSSKNPAKKAANFDSVPESNLVRPPTYPRIIPIYSHQIRQPTLKNVKSSSKAKSANLQDDSENSMQDAVDGTEELEA